MFCTKCGKELVDGAKFCVTCGQPVENQGKNNSSGKVKEGKNPGNLGTAKNPRNSREWDSKELPPGYDDKGNGNYKKILIPVIIVCAIVILISIAVIVCVKNDIDIVETVSEKIEELLPGNDNKIPDGGDFSSLTGDEKDNPDQSEDGDTKDGEGSKDAAKTDEAADNDGKTDTENPAANEEAAAEETAATEESEPEKEKELVITDNLISEEAIREALDSYQDYYLSNYTYSKSDLRLDYLSSDPIPEMVVKYGSVIDVLKYVGGRVVPVCAYTEKDSICMYNPADALMIVRGNQGETGWMYVYSTDKGYTGYVDGAIAVTNYKNGSAKYYKSYSIGDYGMTLTDDDFTRFRSKYADDYYLAYRVSETFKSTEDAYYSLVGTYGSSTDNELAGTKVVKIPLKSAKASSELNVTSSDEMTYYASNIIDGSVATTWCEGAKGVGIDESVTIELDGVHELSTIKIHNGFMKSKRRYTINGKVTRLQIDYGNGLMQTVNMDLMYPGEEDIPFGANELKPMIITPPDKCITDKIVLTILGAEEGSLYDDTGISEVEIYGR